MTTTDPIAEAVHLVDFGKASARKSGRDPRWPYVPVVDVSAATDRTGGFQRTSQILKLAFATREEAVAAAQASIDQARDRLAAKLRHPQYRALREHYGLPRELADLEAVR